MCGIAGFYGFRNDELIKKFSKELEHRGPDGEGFYLDDSVTLLNRRLAIIDRKGGDQPIFNEDGSIVIVFVGEIYNFLEQREKLIKLGHKFRTRTDTEVVVHAYEQWGEKSFDRHNGMFVFALYDKKKDKLLLVRDHFGIKPLYFAILDSVSDSFPSVLEPEETGKILRAAGSPSSSTPKITKLIFSSEIKPIINSSLIKKKPNDRIIYRYLKYRIHDDQRETFFAGINRLMPGEFMTIQNSEFRIQNYTNLKNELLNSRNPEGSQARNLSKKNIAEFHNKLTEAIKLRLISEVPVGTCLSGGLDSSTIVATVNKLLKEKVKEAGSVGKIQNTFSAVFPGGSNNEENYIDELVKNLSRTKLRDHKVKPTPEEFFKEIEEFIRTQEEPTISTGPYAQYKVMQEAHKYVTVLLDGQGADEMMAGYLPYYLVFLKQLWKEKNIITLLKESIGSANVVINVLINQLINTVGIKKKVDINNLLESNFVDKFKNEIFKVENINLKKRLVEDIFSNSLQALLRYEDRNAMRFSIEGRVPFLDYNLLRFLFSLPDEAIIKIGLNKNILRESIKGLVPEKIRLRRNKIGFTTPEYQWFMRMKNKIYSIFLSESFANRIYFNQTEVLNAFMGFIEGKNEDTMVFWRMLNLEIWMRIFLDPPSLKATEGQVNQDSKGLKPNEGKKLEIKVEEKKYLRFPIRTELFKKGDDFKKIINDCVIKFLSQVNSSPAEASSSNFHFRKNLITPFLRNNFFIVVSEKIVAISQGRSYFIWDIKTEFWASLLSKFVKKTPYGIGLGSPWTMQLAINETGLSRILLATVAAAAGKPFGIKGLFYKIAGKDINAIDGPTEYSLYPSNVSAKLGPKDPEKVTEQITKSIKENLSVSVIPNLFRDPIKKNQMLKQVQHDKDKILKNFLGVAIIDANDLGQNVLGNSTGLDSKVIEKIFSDNPMGQSDEQTPLVLVIEKN